MCIILYFTLSSSLSPQGTWHGPGHACSSLLGGLTPPPQAPPSGRLPIGWGAHTHVHRACGTAEAMHVIRWWGGSAPPHSPKLVDTLPLCGGATRMDTGHTARHQAMHLIDGEALPRAIHSKGCGAAGPPTSEWHAWPGAVCPHEHGFRLQLALHTWFKPRPCHWNPCSSLLGGLHQGCSIRIRI